MRVLLVDFLKSLGHGFRFLYWTALAVILLQKVAFHRSRRYGFVILGCSPSVRENSDKLEQR